MVQMEPGRQCEGTQEDMVLDGCVQAAWEFQRDVGMSMPGAS